jgi:hypothetical protein
LDAIHFRQRAAHAREMAQSGDDLRLSRMLLEVALDLDAEADAIEAGSEVDRRAFQRIRPSTNLEGLLHQADPDAESRRVQIISLSNSGARFRVDRTQTPGTKVTLELPGQDLRLDGTILRTRGAEVAMVFDPASSADPKLSRVLRSQAVTDPVDA